MDIKVALAVVLVALSLGGDRAPAATRIQTQPMGLTGRAAADNLACHQPGIGDECLIVTCDNCPGPIPDAPSEQQNGVLIRTLTINQQQVEALGADTCAVNRVKVAVELLHAFVGDVLIGLTHDVGGASLYQPNVACSESDGADGFNGIFGEFGPATKNSCPFETGGGIFPDEQLQSFAGTDLVGDWVLELRDTFPDDAGVLQKVAFAFDVSCTTAPPPTPTPPLPTPTPPSPTPTPAPCAAGANTLCLAGDRFKVETEWETAAGAAGIGNAVELTPDTGYFWFFNQENVELVVKVLAGCEITDHWWVFAGGLTDVEVTMRVTDTQSGMVKTYFNPQKTPFQPLQDTVAFDTCP